MLARKLRLLFVKCKYGRKLEMSKKAKYTNIEKCNNITIMDGKIILNGSLCMKHGSRLGVNNGGKIIIGDNCFFNNNSICCSLGKIEIGCGVSIGPNVSIYDHDHDFNENGKITDKYKIGEISIGNNVWIGAGAIILRNSKIGDNCVIGAGAIIKGEIPQNSLVVGDRNIIIKKLKKK